MSNSRVLFSVSNALCKWLRLDLPRFPAEAGQQQGITPLITDAETISWQCHVIFTGSWRERATVIAVEAYSRFTLLLPFDIKPTQAQLEQRLCEYWAEEMVSLMIKYGDISRDQAPRIFTRFHERTQQVEWVRNTDLSVNGHVNDAEQWVKGLLASQGLDALDDDLALDLAWTINTLEKRAKQPNGKKPTFYPPALFVDDGMFRFVPEANVDSPYQTSTSTPDNVVSLMDYKDKK